MLGGLIGFIRDPKGALTDLISDTWDLIEDISGIVWSEILNPVIEPVVGIFGITDETVVVTDVVSQKLFADTKILSNCLIKGALELQRTDKDYIHILSKIAQNGHSQFNRFYRDGLTKYVDYLPETNVISSSINIEEVKPIIENIEGTTITIDSAYFRVIHHKEWVYWYLQQNYNFSSNTQFLTYNSLSYKLNSYEYNYLTNDYTCSISTVSNIHTTVYEVTNIVVENINPTEDRKTVTVSHRTVKTDENDNVISDVNVVISTAEYIIPKDSETSSETSTIVLESDELIDSSTTTITVPEKPENSSYIVTYDITNVITKIWIYDPTTNVYPSLSDPVTGVTGFDMLPVVTLRSGKQNISETSNPERYKQTKSILKLIGLDVDTLISNISENPDISSVEDAFIYFGLSFTETAEVASKVLYKTFKFIYDNDISDVSTTIDNAKVLTFKETPMNMALAWMPSELAVVDYVIPDNKKYHHEILKSNVIESVRHIFTVTKILYDRNRPVGYQYSKKVKTITYDEISGQILKVSLRDFDLGTEEESPIGGTVSNGDPDFVIPPIGTVLRDEIVSEKSIEAYRVDMYERISSTQSTKLSLINLSNLTIIDRGSTVGVHSQKIDDPDLAIPLSMYIVNSLSLIEKAELFEMTLRFNFYALDVVHIEWYQTKHFASFLRVVAISVGLVMLVTSFGAATPITTILIETAAHIAITIGVSLAVDYLFAQTDSMFLRIVGTIAIAIAGAYFSPASTTIVDDAFGLGMTAVNSFNMIYADKLEALEDSRTAFTEKAESRLEELEEYQKSLDGNLSTLDILYLTQSSDVGSTTNQVKNYYDMALGKVSTNYDLLYKGFYDSKNKKFYDNIYDI